ncbi:MAG TPA: hypothetical protein VEW95_00255 [Candidatus Limnocylindrales bacterium]|nr:hypothetical protein [Candidatus Limnocylindrales bacterium]
MLVSAASPVAGWTFSLLAGGVWGMAFFSWGLPLTIPMRIATTVLLLAAIATASRGGMLAAGAFALGMGASSSILLASSGMLLSDWWGLVAAAALAAGVGLHVAALLRGAA